MPTDIGGGGSNPPHGEDFFNRIVNVHWPKQVVPVGFLVEQGLLVTDASTPTTAVALDTGESFSGVNSGASGKLLALKPFTVLTAGIVVFGKPRDGAACFMACVDGSTILRGVQDISGTIEEKIVWSSVYSVPPRITALSFAGDGFFVTYGSGGTNSSCAVSFDGMNFSEIGSLYSGVPTADTDSQTAGSVAHNGQSYATAGLFSTTAPYPPKITNDDSNLMWASSSDGFGWSSGYNGSVTGDPGTNAGPIYLGSDGGTAFTTIAGGAGQFVAAATARGLFSTGTFDFDDNEIFVTLSTAAAAISSDGGSWSTIKLPGAIEGNKILGGVTNEASSFASSVAFITTGVSKTGVRTGYFIISGNGGTETPDRAVAAWCWTGDGSSWSLVKQGETFGAVSAIAKNLSATEIVNI